MGTTDAKGLASSLLLRLAPTQRVIHPRSQQADGSLAARLALAGVQIHDPIAYDSTVANPAPVLAALTAPLAAITFTSGSAVTGFRAIVKKTTIRAAETQERRAAPTGRQSYRKKGNNVFGADTGNACQAIQNLLVASIGPTTSAVLREQLRPPDIEAPVPSFAALAAAVAHALTQRNFSP